MFIGGSGLELEEWEFQLLKRKAEGSACLGENSCLCFVVDGRRV